MDLMGEGMHLIHFLVSLTTLLIIVIWLMVFRR
jgi:hypothetical protein